MDHVDLKVYENLGNGIEASTLLSDITSWEKKYPKDTNTFYTFIAAYPEATFDSEKEFETALWSELQAVHQLDSHSWDDTVSSDPKDPDFSFSIAGTAFYIVGLHPKSSRMSRQSPCPAIVFNRHSQFEKLREMGTYKTIRDKIRTRDRALQGTVNPMMIDFGKESETRQYSGRKVDENWKCPFHHK